MVESVVSSMRSSGDTAVAVPPRANPLNDFRMYRDGFNLDDPDYVASLAFAGSPGYILGALCFLFGVGFCCVRGLVGCTDGEHLQGFCPTPSRELGEGRGASLARALGSAFVLSFGVVLGAVLAGAGQHKLNDAIHHTADDLFLAANITAEDVVLVTATVQAASSVVTLQGASGSESSNASMEGSDWSLDSDRHKKVERASAALVQDATRLRDEVENRTDSVRESFGVLSVFLLASAFLLVTLVMSGLVAVCTRSKSLLITSFILGVSISMCAWVLFGVVYFGAVGAADFCNAINTWTDSPSETNIDSAFPCVDAQLAVVQINYSRSTVRSLINQSNTMISNLRAREMKANPNASQVLSEYPGIDETYGPIVTSNAPSVMPNWYTPYYPRNVIGLSDTSIPLESCPETYNHSEYASIHLWCNRSMDIVKLEDTMAEVLNCSHIQTAALKILHKHCDPLRTSFNLLWIGFMLSAAALTPLSWLWLYVFIYSQHLTVVDELNISHIHEQRRKHRRSRVSIQTNDADSEEQSHSIGTSTCAPHDQKPPIAQIGTTNFLPSVV